MPAVPPQPPTQQQPAQNANKRDKASRNGNRSNKAAGRGHGQGQTHSAPRINKKAMKVQGRVVETTTVYMVTRTTVMK